MEISFKEFNCNSRTSSTKNGESAVEEICKRHVNDTFTMYEDSSLLLVLAHQRIRGFAFLRYINPRLTLTLTLQCTHILNP